MNLLQDETAYTEFLIKHKLSTNQFLLLYLLYTERMYKGEKGMGYGNVGNIFKWQTKGKGWSKSEIEDLAKKDYLCIISKLPDSVDVKSINDLILTDKFSDLMFINTNFAFEEILNIYPDTVLIGTENILLKSGDLDKLSENYGKLIKNSIDKHNEFKELLLFAKERGMCKSHIRNFITKGTLDSLKRLRAENQPKNGEKEL